MKIGLDLDGVVYDFVAALRFWISSSTGRSPETMPDALSWDFHAEQWNLPFWDFLSFYHEGVNAGVIFSHGEPYPGSREALRTLHAAGHSIHVVTDRASIGSPGVSARLTETWLALHQVPHDSLLLASDKTCIGADVFLEDRPANALALAATGTHVLLLDRPWNASLAAERITRCTWDEVPSLVASLTR